MDSQISAWGRSHKNQEPEPYWNKWFWFYVFFGAAMILFSFHLRDLPLQKSYEGKMAQVAQEIWQGTATSLPWIPQKNFHLQHFPLLELLIALAYQLGGFTVGMTRLPGMLLAATSVPLIYGLGLEIFLTQRKAIFAGFIYLTLLPVISYGRLATGDGAVLFLIAALAWCVGRSRRDLRYCLGIGLCLGLLGLLQGLGGLPWLVITLVFLAWDTPRLLSCSYFWSGIFLGTTPMLGWYGAQWYQYCQSLGWQQAISQFFTTLGQRNLPHYQHWFYPLEVWKYGLPWLYFFPAGLVFAWRQRNWSWARLTLVWVAFYVVLSIFTPSTTWLPLPIYPALSLILGAYFSDALQLPEKKPYPRFWLGGLSWLALIALGGVGYVVSYRLGGLLLLLMSAVALTMVSGAILANRRDWQFLVILFWGCYVSLMLFFSTPYWGLDRSPSYEIKPLETRLNTGLEVKYSLIKDIPSKTFRNIPALK